jgi:acetate kinase
MPEEGHGLMPDNVLITFNAGSSSLKLGTFHCDTGRARAAGRGKIDFDQQSAKLVFRAEAEGAEEVEHRLSGNQQENFGELTRRIIDFVRSRVPGRLVGVAHRVVHGGMDFSAATMLDPDTVDRIERLVPLAPLHQPQALRAIRAVSELLPELPQTASFDTAFHSTKPEIASRLAIPRSMHDEGLRRYGFHGISYKHIAGELARDGSGAGCEKVVAAHLGSGASLCAMRSGRSLDTSMGFSALDGIPMATRPGWIDPGVLLHLMRRYGLDADRLEDFLYHRCGLLGVSGISGDTRDLLEDGSAAALEAIDLFCLRVAGEIGRLMVGLGGLDAIVFTAGVGENQPEIRTRICRHLAWLGLTLDEDRNSRNARLISSGSSTVRALVIPTDEEQVLADEALGLLQADHHT